MPERIIIKTIDLQGFRAFLRPQKVEFGAAGKSLAVLAPNAKGKSSLVDGPEFFLSAEGTLARLGKNKTGNQAGREALQHVEAAAKEITPQVTLTFHDGSAEFSDVRQVVSQDYTRPTAADRVVSALRVPMIIRGYELRHFVENQTAEQRYEEVASWFSLSRLVKLQSSIKDARSAMKKKVADLSTVTERTKDLVRITDNALKVWNEAQVLSWLNDNFLKPLDAALSLTALSDADAAVTTIRTRKDEEEKRVGLDTIKDAISQVKVVYAVPAGGVAAGAIIAFEKADSDLVAKREKEATEKAKAEKAVFKDVWEAAAKILDDNAVPMSSCPVCATDLGKTAAGSRKALSKELATHLGHLKNYRDAVQAFENAKKVLVAEWNGLKSALAKLQALLKAAGYAAEADAVGTYAKEVADMAKTKAIPDALEIKTVLVSVLATIQTKHDEIVKTQGKSTYGKALAKLAELLVVKQAMDAAAAKKAQLETLSTSLYTAGMTIDASIRAYVESIISALRADTNTLYKAIQGGAADCPVIRLELPPAEDVNQRRLSLVIDFGNKTGVPPSGYLSDSQVHTLALSMRLAAMKRLNKTVSVIVLDDIVTSYDADHRRYIATMISSQLSAFQVVLVTHDELFYKELRDVLPPATWDFRRIATLEPDFGPRFSDHTTKDQDIEAAWRQGDSAANLMRQAEEEWLRRICLEFGVDVRIKDSGSTYERSEYAQALYNLLKNKGLAVPLVAGVANPFLNSLRDGVVENFGSHFQDTRYAFGSIGDEQGRWREFNEFRAMFKCPACARTRFERPTTLRLPVCRHCQAPFDFTSAPVAAPSAPPAAPAPAPIGAGAAAVAVVPVQPETGASRSGGTVAR